ncbi:Uu.00g102960.m01.CDS01 [Anthostomella pinea]|uniref:Uu.00g102960.m01.CDS01 n=1 Tax=Anthostomella pinea TaxID=933095 RepID=A0AAI8VEF6_9PEZI|nr:Uu.00g102960.m01.CDS01 [Anthostomella pinea]
MAGNNLLSLLGWSFLPNLVTGWLQTIYYGLTIRAGDPKPAPGSARHAEHRRRIHILVVSLYLLYTIYEADYELQRASNYYADLGVSVGASERDVKSRFRRLAALHHPDKVGANNGGGGGGEDGNGGVGDYFMHLKAASDTLTDPARRFAYERFGPDMLEWEHCVTIRDYVARGAQQVIPYYGLAAVAMWVLGLLGYLDWGRYWRWLTLALLCVFELHAVTRPHFPRLVGVVLNPLLERFTNHAPYLPFQIIALARKLSITLYIAFGQIGPLLQKQQPPGGGRSSTKTGEKALLENLERLELTARGMDVDATRLMELEMAPFAGDVEVVASMRSKLKEWLVQNTVRADPMVRDALGRSLQKRRVDAPAGARGTK